MSNLPKRMADELYHDLMSSQEILEVRKEVRAFADEFVAPRAYDISHKDECVENFPRDVFDAMAKHGIFQIPFAKRDGGRGLAHRVLATATTCEELAYHSNSIAAIFVISILVNVGMWFERFVIIVGSLERDYLPSAWSGYMPTLVEFGALIGSFGLFFTAFLLFCRFLPMISMSEVKTVIHEPAQHAEGGAS